MDITSRDTVKNIVSVLVHTDKPRARNFSDYTPDTPSRKKKVNIIYN